MACLRRCFPRPAFAIASSALLFAPIAQGVARLVQRAAHPAE
jgi:hypothetical protein